MDYNSINHQIHIAGVELRSPYNDGYTQWEIKQELYKIKWLIDGVLADSSKFAGEDEWLDEQEKNKIMRILEK